MASSTMHETDHHNPGYKQFACDMVVLFEDIAAAGKLDEIVCTLGISVCHKAGRWRHAVGVFDALVKLQARRPCFVLLACSCELP